MRKGQDRKVKIARSGSALAGRVGGLGLLALGLALVNPVGMSAYAEDYEIDTQELMTSTVEIGFKAVANGSCSEDSGATNCGAAMTPVDDSGAKAKIDVQATVKVQNSGGYDVYVGSNSSQLKNGDNVINSVTEATTYVGLPTNRWGFSFRKADSSTDTDVLDSYTGMPATLRSSSLDNNKSASITEETRYYMLSFAANIDGSMPAGTYTNNVTMSVVSSPLEVTGLTSLTYMQDMTSAICASSKVDETKQLIDKRDNKKYWVAKLADGNCWMTQNLDLSLSKSVALTSEATDLGYGTTEANAYPDTTVSWTPGFDTTTKLSGWYNENDSNRYYETRSWTQEDTTGKMQYIYKDPNFGAGCTGPATGDQGLSATGCSNYFQQIDTSIYTASTNPEFTKNNGDSPINDVDKVYDAHYLVGNWYQWNAAVAGTGGSDVKSSTASPLAEANMTDAVSSICPRNWRLPTSGGTGSDNPFNQAESFGALLEAYGGDGNTTTTQNNIQTSTLTKSPYFFVRGGNVHIGYLTTSGAKSTYWSSTAYTDTTSAYRFYFDTSTNVHPSASGTRSTGYSVRCIAR